MNGLILPGLLLEAKIKSKPISEFALSNNIIFDSTSVSQFNLSGGLFIVLANELFN